MNLLAVPPRMLNPATQAFSNSSTRRATYLGQPSAENLHRLTDGHTHHPVSQVDMVRMKPTAHTVTIPNRLRNMEGWPPTARQPHLQIIPGHPVEFLGTVRTPTTPRKIMDLARSLQ